ncbi:hypothetical protein D3C86_1848360 [compost metagenome]
MIAEALHLAIATREILDRVRLLAAQRHELRHLETREFDTAQLEGLEGVDVLVAGHGASYWG